MAGGGAVQNFDSAAIPIQALDLDPRGRRGASSVLGFTSLVFTQQHQYLLNQPNTMSQVRTLAVDNSQNPEALTVTHGALLATQIIPGGGGAIIATTSSQGAQTYNLFLSTDAAPVTDFQVGIQLFNYEIAPSIWGTTVVIVGGSVDIGIIALWYSSLGGIPSGWGLCDGSTYTRTDGGGNIVSPDLRSKFILGAGTVSPGTTGGSSTIAQSQLPSASLAGSITPATLAGSITGGNVANIGGNLLSSNGASGNQGDVIAAGTGTASVFRNDPSQTSVGGSTSTPLSGSVSVSLGGSGAQFIPVFYALAYIIKH